MNRPIHIDLTEQEARGLVALASRGRVLLDVDPLFLPRRPDRFAARMAVTRLRAALTPPAHLTAAPTAPAPTAPAPTPPAPMPTTKESATA